MEKLKDESKSENIPSEEEEKAAGLTPDDEVLRDMLKDRGYEIKKLISHEGWAQTFLTNSQQFGENIVLKHMIIE